jgi:endonuclease-8
VPEGDTVWMAARQLHAAMAGRRLTHSDFRVPRLATTSLVGQTVLEVVPRGKHMLTRLDSGLTLHTHFKMDGTWRIYRPGARWAPPEHQIRLVLANEENVAVGYRMPVVELVRDEEAVVGHLGPDVMDEEAFDEGEAVRRLAEQPDREIGVALLDQRNLAGVGNLYRVETCFLERVTPWTPVGEVDLPAVVARAVALMRFNRGRYTQSTTGSVRRHEQHWVFERTGLPCRMCGNRVLSAMQGEPTQERLTYWCPSCQDGPAPEPMRRGARL